MMMMVMTTTTTMMMMREAIHCELWCRNLCIMASLKTEMQIEKDHSPNKLQ